MYYILSESLYDSNQTEAINLLNQVRKSRGLTNVEATKVSTRELFEQEMMRDACASSQEWDKRSMH